MNTLPIQDLVCPQTGEELKLEEGELFTSSTSYPIFNDIPWLFHNPEYSFLEWGTKISAFIAQEKRFIGYLQLVLQSEQNKLTLNRISKLIEAKQKNLVIFEKQLSVFLGHQEIPITSSSQQIQSYFQLIFRDWCWEAEELNEYCNFIKNTSPKNPKNILVLGAGACGLSYQIADHFENAQVYSTDHNPFLFFMANDIMSGTETTLTDYSYFPKNLASTTHQWNINKAPLKNNNHHFILSGFPELPFKKDFFDIIVAPWFFDILEDEYQTSIQHALKHLHPDGTLISIGPANVHKRAIYDQLSSDEQVSYYKNIFSEVSSQQRTVHYLNNPIHSQSRMEEVLFICANKKSSLNNPIIKKKTSKVAFSNELQEYKLLNDTFHRVLKYISGDIELAELTQKVQTEFGFNPEEAEFYTEAIIKKIKLEM